MQHIYQKYNWLEYLSQVILLTLDNNLANDIYIGEILERLQRILLCGG